MSWDNESRREAEGRAKELAYANKRNWCVWEDCDGAYDTSSSMSSVVRRLSEIWELVCWYEPNGTRRTKGDGIGWYYVRVDYEGTEPRSKGSRLYLFRATATEALTRAERDWDKSCFSDGRVRTAITVWPESRGRHYQPNDKALRVWVEGGSE